MQLIIFSYLAFQSLPSDSQKIRSALGGYLYAYEVPLQINDNSESSGFESAKSSDPERRCAANNERLQVEQLDADEMVVNEETAENVNYCDDIKVEELQDEVYVNGPVNSGISENCQQERKLRVEENWFSDNKNKKKSSNPFRLSPKLKAKITPQFSKTLTKSERLRKSSSSSSSEEMSQGSASSSASANSDSGISSNITDCSPSKNKLHVPSQSNGSSRNSSISSIGNQSPVGGPSPYLGHCFIGFVVALHRKMVSYIYR